MNSKNTVSKGPKKRDPTCYRVTQDIVIPAGTILRSAGGNKFTCDVEGGLFLIEDEAAMIRHQFSRVIAA